MKEFCCINLTLSAKLIGAIGLSLSILMVNMIVSDFFAANEEEEFLIALQSWMLFGLNWTYVMKNLQVTATARTLLICVLIYATLSVVANALLALGSARKNPGYAVPWLYFQLVNIIDQTIALGVHMSHDENCNRFDRSVWYLPVSSMYLVISTYFWMVVSSARREWSLTSITFTATNDNYGQQLHQDSNLPKTPSYLSSNVSLFLEFPESMPPPKYETVHPSVQHV